MAHTETAKATWSAAEINDLPDSAFLYVEPGGSKDADGKTTPRTLRHFPYKDANGNVDLPHLRDALSRIPQSKLPADTQRELEDKARRLLDQAQKSASVAKAFGASIEEVQGAVMRAVQVLFPPTPDRCYGPWIADMYDDTVVFTIDGKFYRCAYTYANGSATLLTKPERVVRTYVPIAPPEPPALLADAVLRMRKAIGLAPATKDAMTSSDLASGGALAPEQGGPKRSFQGIDIVIDRPVGFVQRGRGDDGQEWERTYLNDYGFIPGTQGGDGEGLDVFLGPSAEAPNAYWAVQAKSDGTFDEYKLLLGFEDESAARKAYTDHIPERFLKSVGETSVGLVKALLGLEPTEVMKALAEAIGSYFDALMLRTIASASAPAQKSADAPSNDESRLELRLVQKAAGDAEQRFILGIVLEPDVVDAQGDTYNADAIRATAHDWMERFQNLDLQHQVFINGLVMPVESYIAPIDFELAGQRVKAGTWLLGVHVLDDALWAQVKSGAITGFSINGFARKVPVGAAA